MDKRRWILENQDNLIANKIKYIRGYCLVRG